MGQQGRDDEAPPPPPPPSFDGGMDNFGVGGALLPPSTPASPRGRATTWSAGMTTTTTAGAEAGGVQPAHPPPLVTSASSQSSGDGGGDHYHSHRTHARVDPHADAECPRWSEVLKSPSSTPAFSPSLPVGTSLHGLGLTVAVDRAKISSRANRRCASLFSDVSNLHDAFSSSVLTAVRAHTASTASSLKNRNGQHYGMDRLAKEVGACLVSFGKQEQGLAICLKGSVARPLAAGSDSLGEAVPGIFARYANTREECRSARAEAAARRRAYVKAMAEAEVAIAEMQRVHIHSKQQNQAEDEASGDDDPSSGPPPPPPPSAANTPSSSVGPQKAPPPQSPAVGNGGSGDQPPPTPATPKSERPSSSSTFASPFNSKTTKSMIGGVGGVGVDPFSRASWDGALLKRRFTGWNQQKGDVGGLGGGGPGSGSSSSGGTGGGPPGTDTINDRVVRALNAVRTEEARYREAVERENRCVDRSVTMEGMGLESLQKLEEERLQFFVETLGRLLQADKGALDNMSLSLRRFSEDYATNPPDEASSPPRPPSPPSMIKSTSSPAFFVKKASASSSAANSTSQHQQQQSDGGGGGGPTSSSSSSNSAVSVARSLDLPEEIGRLRDGFRDSMSRRTDRFVATRALSQFVEDLAAGAEAFSSGLRARISREGYDVFSPPAPSKSSTSTSSASSSSQQNAKINADPLASSLKQAEGPRCLRCWDAVVESLINCATAASGLAAELRAHNQEHLGKLILTMERDIKALREGEDARWKRLCDAARNEQRTRARLEQYSSELARARERLEAVEGADGKVEEEASSTTKTTPAATVSSSASAMANKNMNPAMSKALGNMFSILPGRGEEAMAKMLTTKQRQAIAKTNVDEAQVKEAREKKVLVATSANKDGAISSYTSVAKAIEQNFGREEMEGWGKAREAFNGIVESFLNFRSLRYSSLIPATDVVRRVGKTAPADTARWTTKMQKKLSKHCKAAESDDGEFDGEFPAKTTSVGSQDDGFMLSVELEESDTVYKLISLVMGEGMDQPEEISTLSPVKESIAETSDAALDDTGGKGDTNSDLPDANSSVRSITRSSSAPVTVEQHSCQSSANTSELLSLAAALKDPDLGGDAAVDDDINEKKDEKQDEVQEPEQVQAQAQAHASKNSETDLFLVHFWDEVGDSDDASTAPPTVIDSFSCAYWPKTDEGYISPLLHGRMFITASALYFIGWGGKKIVLKFEDVASVNKDTTVNGLVDNALRIICSTDEGETSYFFGSFAFREKAFQILNQLMTVSHSLKEIAGDDKKGKKKLPNVPPDETLKKMEILFERKLRGVSIQQFYEICWSEGNNTDAAPFYGPYLLSSGNHDVHVGSWEFGEGGKGFVNDWCGETYGQKRDVTFKYKRTTHLYMGPPIAGVTQTHHVRVEGNDKCVLSMTIKMDGIPYADTFCVEVRWVARRVETNDIQVEVGIFVDFKKPSMFKKQIRSGTVTESKPAHLDLFESARKACASLGGTADAFEEKKEEMDGAETAIVEIEEEKEPFDPLRIMKTVEMRKVGYCCVAAIVVLILVSGYVRNTGYSQVVPDGVLASKADVDDLSRKVDELSEKIEELHNTLKHVMNIQSSCSMHGKLGSTDDD